MEPYISKTQGPCVILAGAGTGKTRSIIEKLKYIINHKVYPIERVVCLTFSNEAVNTLIQRILPYLRNKEPIIRTFHSFCADLLRSHGEKIGIKQNFKIILPDDGKILLHKYFKIAPALCNKYIEEISITKDLGNSLESFSSKARDQENLERLTKILEDLKFTINTSHIKKIKKEDLEKLKEERDRLESELSNGKFVQAWKSYEKIKSNKNGLDYTDLHIKAIELLTKHPEIADSFDYIIVDEFQDTNKVQCQLLDKLAKKRDITIVGDLNQSIYRFRGAYEENFSYFKEIMGVSKSDIYHLEKSYRSTNKILNIAHELIQNNYKNKEDCFKVKNAYNQTGENTKVYELNNSKEEVRKIAEIIKDELKAGTPVKEICIIFRTHQQSTMLKKHLEYLNIPYTSVNKESLLKTSIIKLIRSYLIVLDKLHNKSKGGDNAWWEIIHNSKFDNKDELLITQEIKNLKEDSCISLKLMESKIIGLSKESEIKLEAIKKNINALLKDVSLPLTELIKKLYETLNLQNEEHKETTEFLALERFYEFISDFAENDSEDLSSLIHHLLTIDALDITIESPALIKDGVRIMTNHATKGLEYETVIMSCMVQKKFPMERLSKQDQNKEGGLESQITEERRLCYVGFTRTKKRLYLIYAKEYGQRSFEPSQFLKEINYQKSEDIDFIKDTENLYVIQNETVQIKTQEIKEINMNFSPSALQLFDECQKRYEMKYIYNMPDPAPQSWEAITIGTFIHRVLESAVSSNLKTLKEIEDCAKVIQMEEYKDLILENAIPMIKVFFERNKSRYNENSLTEEYLKTRIENINFNGFADRIDIDEEGNITIVDYKTGKSDIKPKYRNWQLGIYALASKHYGKPKRIILDMLQKEHPLEFELNDQGIAKEINGPRTFFDLNEVKKEIVETAKNIIKARSSGFKSCPSEKNCQFCEDLIKN